MARRTRLRRPMISRRRLEANAEAEAEPEAAAAAEEEEEEAASALSGLVARRPFDFFLVLRAAGRAAARCKCMNFSTTGRSTRERTAAVSICTRCESRDTMACSSGVAPAAPRPCGPTPTPRSRPPLPERR